MILAEAVCLLGDDFIFPSAAGRYMSYSMSVWPQGELNSDAVGYGFHALRACPAP